MKWGFQEIFRLHNFKQCQHGPSRTEYTRIQVFKVALLQHSYIFLGIGMHKNLTLEATIFLCRAFLLTHGSILAPRLLKKFVNCA